MGLQICPSDCYCSHFVAHMVTDFLFQVQQPQWIDTFETEKLLGNNPPSLHAGMLNLLWVPIYPKNWVIILSHSHCVFLVKDCGHLLHSWNLLGSQVTNNTIQVSWRVFSIQEIHSWNIFEESTTKFKAPHLAVA